MRLPRRVPWASLSELDQVCSWIYSDENDLDSKVFAVNRLSAWKAITPLPHALEAALSILTAMLQDASSQNNTTFLSLRQSYATAIIRLVNGLVDSLQVGAYARSIASIATQLGLPAWFVELRHSATHEDLPSLEVLRTAAHDAMRWLLNNYFLPTLNPSSQRPLETPSLRPLAPLLQKYKTLLKAVTRDASLRNQLKDDVAKTLRDIERWMAEAKVAAHTSLPAFDWDVGNGEQDGEQEDIHEKWVLDLFCDQLLGKGVLVPLSKKKRLPLNNDVFEPPERVLHTWKHLVAHVCSLHRGLLSSLVSKIITHLTSGSSVDSAGADTISLLQHERDATLDICLATWANWLVNTYSSADKADDDEGDQRVLNREDVVLFLLSCLRPDKINEGSNEKIARKLLKVLCHSYPHLDRLTATVPVLVTAGSSDWRDDEDLEAMSRRLDALAQHSSPGRPLQIDSQCDMQGDLSSDVDAINLLTGWKALDRKSGWRPAPIGIFVHPTTLSY